MDVDKIAARAAAERLPLYDLHVPGWVDDPLAKLDLAQGLTRQLEATHGAGPNWELAAHTALDCAILRRRSEVAA